MQDKDGWKEHAECHYNDTTKRSDMLIDLRSKYLLDRLIIRLWRMSGGYFVSARVEVDTTTWATFHR
jgi:hypothetical protein